MHVASDRQILCAGRFFASSASLPESTQSGSKGRLYNRGPMSESLQGIRYLTDVEATELIGRDRESHQRDLFESIEKGEYITWKLFVQIMDEKDANDYHIKSLRSNQGVAAWRYPLIELGIDSQPGNLKRRFALQWEIKQPSDRLIEYNNSHYGEDDSRHTPSNGAPA